MKNKIKFTKQELKEWNACKEGYESFCKQFPTGEASLEKFMKWIKEINKPDWAGWVLYHAGRYWSEDRWDTAIRDVLVETKDAFSLYRAGLRWSEDRWSTAIRDALIETKDAQDLYYAGLHWSEDRKVGL